MHRPPRIFAAILILIGLTLAVGGVRLVTLGGSFYYVLAGLAILASAVLLWRRDRRGSLVYGLLLAATVLWSFYEVGVDLWALAPRVLALLVIGAWFLTPWFRRSLYSPAEPPPLLGRRGTIAVLAGIVVVGVTANVIGARASVPAHEAKPPTVPTAPQAASSLTPLPATTGTDWQNYGGTTAGTRYVRLDQLTPDNVGKLQEIWHFRTGRGGAFKATPIQIGDLLYACTGGNVIVALDAETGAERWRFDPEVKIPPISNFGTSCRGVSYYRAPETYAGDCVERIITATTDARMFAVDAKTGQRCTSFAGNGEISLLSGMGEVKQGFYFVTSPPTIARGRAIVGGWVLDNREIGEPSGVVRAFDVLTGKFAWAWDMGRPGVHTEPGEGEWYTRGTPNVWSLTSYDDKLGLVYVPTGNATPDYYDAYFSDVSERSAPKRRRSTRRRSSRSTWKAATCAGRSRPCITTSGITMCRRSRCCSSCRKLTARQFRRWCKERSAASCSCSIDAPAHRSPKCASSRCRRARCPAIGPRRRSRSRSACRSSAAPISPNRTCGA